jgi:hypothetical protein
VWERGIPNPTDGTMVGFDAPYDCGDKAFVTGNDPNLNGDFDDVDEGQTNLISPQMDLTSYSTPYINYARAFFCFHGVTPFDDTLKIFLSNGTTSVLIDQIGGPHGNLMNFEAVSIPIAGLLPITTTMQLTIRISDEDPNINVTEAAFDHFRVTEISTLSNQIIPAQDNLLIYPNPTKDFITISGVKEDDLIQLFDIQGRLYVNGKSEKSSYNLNLNGIKSGAYFLKVNDQVFKIVKE